MASVSIKDLLGLYNARDYGFIPWATADNQPAIQRAVEVAHAAGGGKVVVPADTGVLGIGASIQLYDDIELVIESGATLKLIAGANTDLIKAASGATARIRVTGRGTIDGNRAANTSGTWHGINFASIVDALIDGVLVKSCRTNGINLSSCARPKVKDVIATDCGTHGVALSTCTYHVLENVHSYDNSRVANPGVGDGINLASTTTDGSIVAPVAYDSRTAQEAAPAAPTAALAGAGAGNVDNGDHAYLVTLLTQYGESDGGTPSGAVTVADKTADGKVALSAIPTGTAGVCTARKIYRTVAGGSSYKLLATISDNTTTTYTDNIADASLGAAAPTLNTSGKRQGYGVREAAASSCDRNTIVGGALAGNATGAVSTVGASSKLVDNRATIATVGTPTPVGTASLGTSVQAAPLDHGHALASGAVTAAKLADDVKPAMNASPIVTGTLTMSNAVSKLVPGATSFSLRNNADNADNLKLLDTGEVQVRGQLRVADAYLGNSPGITRLHTTPISFANNATIDIPAYHGFVFFVTESGTGAAFWMSGGSQTTGKISEYGAPWSTTKDNPGSFNFYWDAVAGTYRVQNKIGWTTPLTITIIGPS